MNSPSDHLLYVLSAKTEMNWSTFKKTVDEILQDSLSSTDNVRALRNRVLRLLDAFGFCDVSFEKTNGRVCICPATVVRLPIQGCSAIVIGSRSPATVEQLDCIRGRCSAITMTVDSSEDSSLLPSRIGIDCEDPTLLQEFADLAQIPLQSEPPSWTLSQFATDIRVYWNWLEWTDGPDLNWRSWEFNPEFCEFRERAGQEAPLRLIRYLSPITNTFRYRLWDGSRFANVDLDWGRYCVLERSGFDVLFYDPSTHRFAVPRNAYLPRVLQRALGLCSGMSPLVYGGGDATASGRALDLFQLVPRKIAECVSGKLGQSISYCSLS
jgi:hypothetical protein